MIVELTILLVVIYGTCTLASVYILMNAVYNTNRLLHYFG